jgi:hypothetical protein
MGLNVTNVFIQRACDALKHNLHKLEDDDREDLCDKLVNLCMKYAPGTFVDETEDKSEDINHLEDGEDCDVDDDSLDYL